MSPKHFNSSVFLKQVIKTQKTVSTLTSVFPMISGVLLLYVGFPAGDFALEYFIFLHFLYKYIYYICIHV
uniref:Uncharacterized protein n=1 Tax=Bos mutus grunniens TaxID=30521 RepID=A0A8C0ALL2_BOSMU